MYEIPTHSELKQYNIKQLEELCAHLRENVMEAAVANGGHLSSNLGVIELTVALHYVYDLAASGADKLVLDVGHQCYAHKMLTGRDISTIRQKQGVSGFLNTEEGDLFTTGHSGTSIASAIGLCIARDALGEDYNVIGVVGDGSLVNGLNLEAVMSSSNKPDKMVIVINDNGLSISKNTTALYKTLSRLTIKKSYLRSKSIIKKLINENSPIGRGISTIKFKIKRIINKTVIFDLYGMKYVGPVDGHNLGELISVLKDVKKNGSSVILHTVTKKGKGYELTEQNASLYHGTGKNLKASVNSFSAALSRLLVERASQNERLYALTAAMADGVGLTDFAEAYPKRFIDVGINEEYAVTLAGGLARGGLRPVVCIYSTFLQRAYDQIMVDVCLQNLPVIFCIDRSGLVGNDGKSHQGVFDSAYLRQMPNMNVFAPKDAVELEYIFDYAYSLNAPCAIKYPNGEYADFSTHTKLCEGSLWEEVESGDKVALLACGPRALKLAVQANEQRKDEGLTPYTVINCRTVSPLDEKLLSKLNVPAITIEDTMSSSGFFGAVAEHFALNKFKTQLDSIGVARSFLPHATVAEQMRSQQITVKAILSKAAKLAADNN